MCHIEKTDKIMDSEIDIREKDLFDCFQNISIKPEVGLSRRVRILSYFFFSIAMFLRK